jgi:hypothetical protein
MIHNRTQQRNKPDIEQLFPNFGIVPRLCIQHTLDHTTQIAWLDSQLPLRKHFKTCFPAAYVSRLNLVVTTNTYFSDTPALDDCIMGHGGTKMVQPFCGCQSLLTVVYPKRCAGNIAGTLENFAFRAHLLLC